MDMQMCERIIASLAFISHTNTSVEENNSRHYLNASSVIDVTRPHYLGE